MYPITFTRHDSHSDSKAGRLPEFLIVETAPHPATETCARQCRPFIRCIICLPTFANSADSSNIEDNAPGPSVKETGALLYLSHKTWLFKFRDIYLACLGRHFKRRYIIICTSLMSWNTKAIRKLRIHAPRNVISNHLINYQLFKIHCSSPVIL